MTPDGQIAIALDMAAIREPFVIGWSWQEACVRCGSFLPFADLTVAQPVPELRVEALAVATGGRSNARDEPSSGTRSDETAGTRGKSQSVERSRSTPGTGGVRGGAAGSRGNEPSGSSGSRGQDSSSGKADNRGGAAGSIGRSGGNRGRN